MITALPMYDWPEARAETDAFYTALRARVPELPEALTRDRAPEALWRDPTLVFSQCCWGPLRAGLSAHLQVLAQPDYSNVEGGRGPFYRSAIVARQGKPVAPPQGPRPLLPPLSGRLAVNGRESLSGFLALAEDVGDPDAWARAVIETGSHRDSIRAVARGEADLAAIDCRSWALARRFEPCAKALVVVGWTAERLGLPYVSARGTDAGLVARLREALRDLGCHLATEG